MLSITIGPTGAAQSMYNDDFHIGFLGSVQVRRATEIVFNDSTQKWDIHYLQYTEVGEVQDTVSAPQLCGFDKYDEARRIEVAWLNQCRASATDPISPQGLHSLGSLR